jgi:hypothetical protein
VIPIISDVDGFSAYYVVYAPDTVTAISFSTITRERRSQTGIAAAGETAPGSRPWPGMIGIVRITRGFADHNVHDGAPTLMAAGIMMLTPKGVYWGTRRYR